MQQIQVNTQQKLQHAMELHQQGKFPEAEQLYKQILAVNPNEPNALCYLGVMAHQLGRNEVALKFISDSLKIAPNNLNAHMNMGNIYQAMEKYAEAGRHFEKAIRLNPNIPELRFNLGNLLDKQGKHDLAIAQFRKAISLKSDWAAAYIHLGLSQKALGKTDDAIDALKEAVQLDPDSYEAVYNLGLLYHTQSAQAQEPQANNGLAGAASTNWEKAIKYYLRAIALKPENPELMVKLAIVYSHVGAFEQAEKLYHQAIALKTTDWECYFNLGWLYQENMRYQDAESCYQRALTYNSENKLIYRNLALICEGLDKTVQALEYIEKAIALDPLYAPAYSVLAHILKSQGRIAESLVQYKKAIELDPGYAEVHSNYLFAMHSDPAISIGEIYRESLNWAARHADPISWLLHHNDRNPNRRLRIGYVSGDLHEHALVRYFEPVIRSHDKSQVEIFCYANQPRDDAVTERLKSYADCWRNIFRLSDDAAAALIQEDKIDILIDLSGHTSYNRLLLFARKPAPLQATWIGYFNTVGMKAMDYLITDRFLLPPEEEHLYVEKPLRLPNSSVVYSTYTFPIEVNALPALINGYITFGSFNAISKITPQVNKIWAEILKRVPNAVLYFKSKSFGNIAIQQQYRDQFSAFGVDSARLKFSGASPLEEYLEHYNYVDIGLDPFPYNGSTTTRDSFWMGVPVVAIKGDRLVSHTGESLLGALGLEEFIAGDEIEYVEKAVAMANNLPRLAEVRASLRQTLTAAPLTNPILFTRGLEEAFRDIWKEWCSKQ